jgi:serine/threonine protein kinase
VSHLSQQPTDRPPIEWRKGELIGKGSFGKVYMGMNGVTGELLAVKRIKLSSEEDHVQAAQIETETSLLKDLNHENIVKLIATQRHNHYLDIIMEYIPGKSLDVLLEKFGVFSEKII